MAEFEYNPNEIDDIIRKLSQADLYTEENQSRLIKVGAESVLDGIKNAMGRSNFNISKFRDKIKISNKIKKDKYGNNYVTISPQGKYTGGGKPRRVAEILFVLNYGRQKKYGEIQGDYFWTNGVKRGEKTSVEDMREEVNKIYHERGLI